MANTKAPQPDDPLHQLAAEVAALKVFVRVLLEQARDNYARTEALRAMLADRGDLPASEFADRHAAAVAEWNQAVETALSKAIDEGNALAARAVLEQFRGKPH